MFRQTERLDAAPLGTTSAPMTEIVNLKHVRKGKARAVAEQQAEVKRAAHGRTKAEKTLSEAQKKAAQRALDAHKRDSDG